MTIQEYIDKVIKCDNLPYMRVVEKDGKPTYEGWVSTFSFKKHGEKVEKKLFDTTTKEGLFALLVMAQAWSRTGQYENAMYYVAFLNDKDLLSPDKWMTDSKLSTTKKERASYARTAEEVFDFENTTPRKSISFRSEFFTGTKIVAEHFDEIVSSLKESEKKNDYSIFVNKIRSINGLGGSGTTHKMLIKIPLILRELRIQDSYKNIPGEWCCVPDERVKDACAAMGISLSTRGDFLATREKFGNDSGILKMLKESEVIYRLFGDLYDMPLFAYQDVM